jgi:hypothetical protein
MRYKDREGIKGLECCSTSRKNTYVHPKKTVEMMCEHSNQDHSECSTCTTCSECSMSTCPSITSLR